MEPFIQYFNRYPNFNDVKDLVTSNPLNFTWENKFKGNFHYRIISRLPRVSLAYRNVVPNTVCTLSNENDWEPKEYFTKVHVYFDKETNAIDEKEFVITVPYLRFRVLNDLFDLHEYGINGFKPNIKRNFEHGAVFELAPTNIVKTTASLKTNREFSFFKMHENQQRWLFKGWRQYNAYESVTGDSQTEKVLKALIKLGYIERNEFLHYCRILDVKINPSNMTDEFAIEML